MTRPRTLVGLGGTLSALLTTALLACSPQGAGMTDWPMYRGDLAGTGYSPLDEIDVANVSGLARSWSYALDASNSQATPIVVGEAMYVPAADRVVALDPVTGAEIWRHVVDGNGPSRRGVAYWAGNGDLEARILFAAGSRLIAIDAASGARSRGFGVDGEVDIGVPYNSVPLVFEDVVVVGANTPPGEIGGIGNARAYDARTGAELWEFSSVPQPGSVGHDTWADDSWRDRLGANAWPFYFTVDAELGLLYLPLASPIPGAYGGDRGGDNLFGNSVVAVDARTGAYRWHFQTIHHDLWDADPPAPPVLFDVDRGGSVVRALGVTTKSGYLYLLDRETGEPLYGVEERPVPASDVPGELASPTQPVPVLPPPMARVSYTPADLVTADDTSPEHAAACAALVESVGTIVNDGPFTPWAYRGAGVAPRTTLLFPGLVGGPNWGGAAYDPTSGYVFVLSQDIGSFGWMQDDPDGTPQPYARGGPRPATFDVAMNGQRWPCQRPPWGRLVAVDGASGRVVWERPIGVTDGLPSGRQDTGRPGRAGAIVTGGGLLFVASTDDARFRALEASTGRELWADRLDAVGNANPMTYLGTDARQYVAIVATDAVHVYRLP
ncbi:MAG: PQQ-binding-like beta-propeller repeat protein [Gemmatimonadales bacterium]